MLYVTHKLRDELRDQASHALWKGVVPAIKAIVRELMGRGYPADQAASVEHDRAVQHMIQLHRGKPIGSFVVWRDFPPDRR